MKVKQGVDHVTKEGEVVPNHELALPAYRQRSYAYISDTVYDPDLAHQVKGVDLLFHEATFSNRDEKLARETMHTTSEQAATIASAAGVGKLLIGHFSSRYKDLGQLVEEARNVFGDTEGVNDGDVHSVQLVRTTTE